MDCSKEVINIETREGILKYIKRACEAMMYDDPKKHKEEAYNKGLMTAIGICDVLGDTIDQNKKAK